MRLTHHEPMTYKISDLKKFKAEGGLVPCDVCRAIDLDWLEAAKVDSGIPDLPGLVVEAMKRIIQDYNTNPGKYPTICENKFEIARKETAGLLGDV